MRRRNGQSVAFELLDQAHAIGRTAAARKMIL